MAHAEMSEDDRNRSMQMQSFLKHLESQMDKEDNSTNEGLEAGAPPHSFTSLKAEQDQIKEFMMQLQAQEAVSSSSDDDGSAEVFAANRRHKENKNMPAYTGPEA